MSSNNHSTTNGMAKTEPDGHESEKPFILVWSANDENATKRMTQDYQVYYLSKVAGLPERPARLAHTLAARRTLMDWRSFAIVGDGTTLAPSPTFKASQPRRASNKTAAAFIFTGQGAQYARMGLDLCCYSVFSEALKSADAALKGFGCEWSLMG